jgi:hypothetical protein
LHFWCRRHTRWEERISNNKTKTLAYRLALAAEKAVVAGEFEGEPRRGERSFFRDNESWRSSEHVVGNNLASGGTSTRYLLATIHATRVLWRSLVPRHI